MVDAVLICNIYVLPRYRRLGIGKALLQAALTLYPGKPMPTATSGKTKPPAKQPFPQALSRRERQGK